MAVPRIFQNLPDGLSLPLSWFDEDFAYLVAQLLTRQVKLALTTLGNSGPATLDVVGNLNIPNYASGVSGGAVIGTAVGPYAVAAGDTALVLNKPAPSATIVNLPSVVARAGLPWALADYAGNAGDITINANGGELIMGLGSAVLGSAGPGVGTAAAIVLIPSVALGGWFIG